MSNPTIQPPSDGAAVAETLRVALGQIEFARSYVLELLAATPEELWFEIPAGGQSNVAWQVGHLAVSQYGLLMFRQRGRLPEDLDLVPGRFRKRYGRGGSPLADPSQQPSAGELLERMQTIYEAAVGELNATAPEHFLEPVEMPYAVYPNKLGAVFFCPLHEQLHAGQIGVLRRGLGLESIR